MAVNKESDCNTKFFTLLELKGPKEVLNWCMTVGLISNRYECPKCGEDMRLEERKGTNYHFEWRCRKRGSVNPHDVTRSVRRGSWFSNSGLSICDLLRITRFWFGRCMNEFVVNEIKINKNVVVDWFMQCREICLVDIMNKSSKIGGESVTVEIVKSQFGESNNKRAKRAKKQDQWVVGGFEKNSDRYFLISVEDQSNENLLTVIKEWVFPGSILMSDYWQVHDCLEDEGFVNLQTNYNLTFIDLDPGQHSNAIEEMWLSAKRFFVSKHLPSLVEGEFDTYLAEYMWRKMHNHSMSDDTFKDYLRAVASVYHPPSKDASI